MFLPFTQKEELLLILLQTSDGKQHGERSKPNRKFSLTSDIRGEEYLTDWMLTGCCVVISADFHTGKCFFTQEVWAVPAVTGTHVTSSLSVTELLSETTSPSRRRMNPPAVRPVLRWTWCEAVSLLRSQTWRRHCQDSFMNASPHIKLWTQCQIKHS